MSEPVVINTTCGSSKCKSEKEWCNSDKCVAIPNQWTRDIYNYYYNEFATKMSSKTTSENLKCIFNNLAQSYPDPHEFRNRKHKKTVANRMKEFENNCKNHTISDPGEPFSSPSDTTNIGNIIVVIIGVLAILTILVTGFYYYGYKRRRK